MIVPKPKGLNCPNCGAAIELRALGAAASVVCGSCLTTLDATDPNLRVLAEWKKRQVVTPKIPLGTRGKLRDTLWEVIGFAQRGITVEDVLYTWDEYVLFNPYKGFRYLTEYNGHWNFISPLHALPSGATVQGKSALRLGRDTFRHFQSAMARTLFVLGEFPWMVSTGDTVRSEDYVSPPLMLSSERTQDEVTWSLGEYTLGREIWQAFQMPGSAPPAAGVFSNQPNPAKGAARKAWRTFLLLSLILLGVMFFFSVSARRDVAYEKTFTFNARGAPAERAFVTDVFALRGRTANVEIDLHSDLENASAFFNLSLINQETGETWDFGREVGHYAGTDSDGSWSEGSRDDSSVLPSIPAGTYFLRVEPEMDVRPAGGGNWPQIDMTYRIKVIRDVPYYLRYFLGILLLLIPVILSAVRESAFETRRWSESDFSA